MLERQEDKRGARVLGVFASVVVVVAGPEAGGEHSLALLSRTGPRVPHSSVMMWLRRYGVPTPLAILISVLLVAAVVGGLLLLASQAFAEFQARYPQRDSSAPALGGMGGEAGRGRAAPRGHVFAALTDLFSLKLRSTSPPAPSSGSGPGDRPFLVLLIMVFILAEAAVFPRKLRMALGDVGDDSIRLTKMFAKSDLPDHQDAGFLATGTTIGLFAAAIGLDFPSCSGSSASSSTTFPPSAR